MTRFFSALVICSMVSLSACATRPTPLLVPSDFSVEGSTAVSVLTVSTRQRSYIDGQVYTGERGDVPSMMNIEVSIPPTHVKGHIDWPQSDPNGNPATEFTTLSKDEISDDGALSWFKTQHTNGQVLIFVHGFNVKYAEAVYRVAQISNDLGTGAAPVLFTWPSRGKIMSYLYDKESATFSRDALEEVLQLASETPEG